MSCSLWKGIPMPWYVASEFVRQTWAGFALAFGAGYARLASQHSRKSRPPTKTRQHRAQHGRPQRAALQIERT